MSVADIIYNFGVLKMPLIIPYCDRNEDPPRSTEERSVVQSYICIKTRCAQIHDHTYPLSSLTISQKEVAKAA